MKSALHLTAAASLLAMVSLGAAAAPMTVSLDFENQGTLALNAAAPVAVNSVQGINFTGAWAYKFGMFASGDVVSAEIDEGTAGVFSCPSGPCNETGYISNRGRPSTGGSILTLTLDPTAYLGLYITSFNFDIWHNGGGSSSIRFIDNSSGTAVYQDWANISDGNKLWSRAKDSQNVTLAKATSVEFNFGAAALGLDNLQITVDGPGAPPPGVPEPASYALVGLALLAAGASRRRKA